MRPAAPPPTIYRDGQGDERLLGRRPALHLDGHMYCPAAHRIKDVRIGLEEDTWRCTHEERGQRCNVLLYVLCNFTARDGTELLWAVEVTYDEIRRMRRMTIAEKLLYLEVTWAPT